MTPPSLPALSVVPSPSSVIKLPFPSRRLASVTSGHERTVDDCQYPTPPPVIQLPPKRQNHTQGPPTPPRTHPKRPRDAYEAFSSSPDAEWTTFSPRKKSKNGKNSDWGKPTTGKFRLPLALPRIPEDSSDNPPRKLLYKPPPKPSSTATDRANKAGPTTWKVTRMSAYDIQKGLAEDMARGRRCPSGSMHGAYLPSSVPSHTDMWFLIQAQTRIPTPLHPATAARPREILSPESSTEFQPRHS